APGGATRTAALRLASALVSAGNASSIGSGNSNDVIDDQLTLTTARRGRHDVCDIYANVRRPSENETALPRNEPPAGNQMSFEATTPGRVDWVDYAKGFCIVMVVMMHSTLGVEAEAGREGFMHYLVAFARPFRMPDFFMISGLFLARVIDRDWRTYLDRKVVHFAYFYLLWTAIQ